MNLNLLEFVALGLSAAASLTGAGHALLSKTDPRSAAAWVTLCLLFPLVGVLVYAAIGNNRISARAQRLYTQRQLLLPFEQRDEVVPAPVSSVDLPYHNLDRLAYAVSGHELLGANRIDVLYNGEAAYPAMIDAIGQAQQSICLSSYIFESFGIGEQVITALHAALQRGVDVRVLLDGIGGYYSIPSAAHKLRRLGVTVALFLPPRLLPPNFSLNLRNHRKILLIDDRLAFTGGMNIRNKLLAPKGQRPAILDLHFRIQGPVVAQIQEVFAADWQFCGGNPLSPVKPLTGEQAVNAYCRVITDGPSENLDKLTWVLAGAISVAQRSIKIMTPYFLPSRVLTVALQTAVLRGVQIDIILPRRNNLRFMNWAAWHVIRPLVATGISVHFFEGPFVHSKLFLVDDYYAQVGSANLDPRSLRLNFEIAVEIYDRPVCGELAGHFAESLGNSRRVTRHDLASRDPVRRLRDAIIWLFSPYL